MLYLPKLDLGILLIPRCGSKWITTVVRAMRLGRMVGDSVARHRPASRRHGLKEHNEFTPDTKWAAFVRHPIDRLESCWAFLDRKHQIGRRPGWGDGSTWAPDLYCKPCFSRDFNATMRAIIEREPALCTRVYEWYCGPEGAERVDYIGRQEHLQEHLQFILADCGCDEPIPDVPRLNRSPHDRGMWDPGLLAEMTRLEAPAIRRFYEDDTIKFC